MNSKKSLYLLFAIFSMAIFCFALKMDTPDKDSSKKSQSSTTESFHSDGDEVHGFHL